MSQREKLLGGLVGCLLAVFGLALIYTTVRDGLESRRTEVSHIQDQITTAKTTNTFGKRARKRVFEYQKRSLPADGSAAQVAYDHWLHAQVDQAGLEKTTVSPQGIPRNIRGKKPYNELSYTVIGEADVKQLTKFLYGFYSTDNLHRIRSLNIVPRGDSRRLNLVMMIDALTMPDLDPRKLQAETESTLSAAQLAEMVKKNPIGTISEDRLPYSLAEYESQITGRNLFAPANLPPEIKSIDSQKTQVGKTLTLTAEATDPEGDEVTFELGSDVAEGARISESGRFRFRPKKEGRFRFTIQAIDKGAPPKAADPIEVTVVVAAREESTAFEGIDESELAVLTAFVQGRFDRGPMMWMHLRSEDEIQYLAKGDKIKIGTWEGVVKSVDLRHSQALIETEEGDYLLRIGQTLADAEFIEAEEYNDTTDVGNTTDIVPTSATSLRQSN